MSLKIWTIEELVNSDIPEDHCHIPSLLPIGGMLLLSADEKCFKSYLALDIGTTAARGGLVLFKYQVPRPLSVLYIEAEVGVHELKGRVKPILKFNPEVGGNFKMITKDLRIQLDTDEGKLLLGKALDEIKPDILILDPIVEFHKHNENDPIEMKTMMKPLRDRMSTTGMGLIVVHHNNKANGLRPQSPRGAYLKGAANSIMEIHKSDLNSDEVIDIKFTVRSAKKPNPMRLKFQEETSSFTWINKK